MSEESKKEVIDLNIKIDKLKGLLSANETELEKLRKEVGTLQAEMFVLKKDKELLTNENTQLKTNISGLQNEKAELQKQIQSLEAEAGHPKLLPEQLTASLRDAISKMEDGLKTVSGRTDYTVAKFDADIKVAFSVGDENKIFIKLPYVSEEVTPENLSTIKLSLKSKPKPRVPLIKVPLLIGMSKDSAVQEIQALGLKAKILEKRSKSSSGLVIDQKPEAYTEVPSKTVITLIVAIPEKIKAPNLINMEKETAIKVINELDLLVGKIESKLSKVASNIVIGQNPLPDSEIERGSSIDLVVSVRGVKVPNLKGMKETEAKLTIQKTNLSAGTVTYEKTLSSDRVVIAQSPEPDSEVLPTSRINLTIAESLSLKEIKERISSHPEAKKYASLLNNVFIALEKLGIGNSEDFRELMQIPEGDLMKKLGLKTKTEFTDFKRLLNLVFKGFVS
ncbi:MAG TPA: PASTA domain-containing protein [Candidatus Saccharicenans sp.]|nr:PASTA domain-containing protein [Candidatus Saccharicenans sp.]HRD02781.1 PASTA domain-containing protein [Candidatus Saccharicenans sp.]